MSSIVTATVQSTLLASVSNIVAQLLQAYQANEPLSIDFSPLLTFALFTALNTPPNFLWQQFLEETFPGYSIEPAIRDAPDAKPHAKEIVPKQRLNKWNTVLKILLDQTIGASVNTMLFIVGMAALRGEGTAYMLERLRSDWWTLMLASYRVWPLVSFVCFVFIPFELRIIFGSLVGLGWNVFLCLFAAG